MRLNVRNQAIRRGFIFTQIVKTLMHSSIQHANFVVIKVVVIILNYRK